MTFSAELFLAWRYFKPKRNAVSVITLISVIGVALGVCVLLVVLAVMTGFTDHLKSKLLETGAHGQIQKRTIIPGRSGAELAGRISEPESEVLCSMLKRLGAADAMPVLKSPVLMQTGENFHPKLLIAFDPARETPFFPLRKALKNAAEKEQKNAERIGYKPRNFGHWSLGAKEIFISAEMANEFHLQAGDKILLHTPARLMSLIQKDESGRYTLNRDAEKYLPAEFKISGVYSFDKYDFDRDVLFMALDEADDLFGLEWGDSTGIHLWTDDPFHMDSFNERVRAELSLSSPGLLYFTWQDMHRRILEVLAVEKNMMFFLLIFIVLVAAFSITNTLITTVIQKTKEIGLLKATGAGPFSILRIFLLQGLFVGWIGTGAGVGLGYLVVTYRMTILSVMRKISGMEIFPRQIYLFHELPAHIVWSDVAAISVISVLLCTCGALVPALRAARLDPAKALRYE